MDVAGSGSRPASRAARRIRPQRAPNSSGVLISTCQPSPSSPTRRSARSIVASSAYRRHRVRRDRDGAGSLDRRDVQPDVREAVEAALVGDGLPAPERAQDLDPLDHAADPLPGRRPHRGELGVPLRPARRAVPGRRARAAADARHHERAALAQEVERGPLVGEDDGVAQDEARQARRAQRHAAGPAGHQREEDDGVDPGLGDQVVAGEDGVEQLGAVRPPRTWRRGPGGRRRRSPPRGWAR